MSQQRLRFEKIVNVAKSMDSLVNQLLFLARHEGRLVTESLKEIDLTSGYRKQTTTQTKTQQNI